VTSERRDLMVVEDKLVTGVSRWVPMCVVTGVVTGFIALAWYAYHTGMQSMRDEDLLVVEADKTPMKEKPLDPGGMQFPNQDKTIFDTFAGKSQQQPKVERVLPRPEEPMRGNADTDTTSWVNDAARKPSPLPTAEQIFAKDKSDKKPTPPVIDRKMPAPAKPIADDQSETYVAAKAPASPSPLVGEGRGEGASSNNKGTPLPNPLPQGERELVKSEVKTIVPPTPAQIPPPEKPVAEAPKPTASLFDHGGAFKVQLGAYRSEKEATDAWKKMQKKQPTLSGREPQIVKADLGAKGIYYRLRVGGLSTAADAKAFCSTLKGQACMLTMGN